jgi:Glycosyltransferase like family
MISIIICSVNPVSLADIKKNIEETIGVPYEIVVIDNSANRYGICRAYNEGGSRARFPLLCFMHEDIAFETAGWGEIVRRHLSNPRTGLLGVAGSDAKSLVPSCWTFSSIVSSEINLVQHYRFSRLPPLRIRVTGETQAGPLKKVVAVDGLWLCTKREVFDRFKFDEATFTGFHGYDIDFSLQVSTRYDVCVAFDIVVHHFSEGKRDRQWLNSAVAVSRKWKKRLPASVYDLSHQEYRVHHWQTLHGFLDHLFRLKYGTASILRHYFAYSFTRFFTVRRFISMGKYVLANLLKRIRFVATLGRGLKNMFYTARANRSGHSDLKGA